ncbi:unnamed protein product [Rotaria sp. Silwood2]|nr:unnamed protein product [Rotaria sp. Silwood2]
MTDNIEKQLADATQSPYLFMKEDDLAMIKRYYKMLKREALQLQDIPASTISQLCGYSYSNLGIYEKAIEFYNKLLLDKNFTDRPKFIIINIMIGYHYFHLLQYDNAFLYCGIAL